MKRIMILWLCSAFFILSCSKSTNSGGSGPVTLDCNTVTAKAFAADVSPIIQANCTGSGCHGVGSTSGPGALTTYSQIFNARSNIRAAVSSGVMPQGSSLPASQKNSILCWIDSGAPNN